MAKNKKKFLRTVDKRMTEEGYELAKRNGNHKKNDKHLVYKHKSFPRCAITVPTTPKGDFLEQEQYLEQHIRRNAKLMIAN